MKSNFKILEDSQIVSINSNKIIQTTLNLLRPLMYQQCARPLESHRGTGSPSDSP